MGIFQLSFLLIFSVTPLWSKRIHCMCFYSLKILRYLLWPRIWPLLATIPCEFEKNVDSTAVEYSLQMSITYVWLKVLLSMPLLILSAVSVHYWERMGVSNHGSRLFCYSCSLLTCLFLVFKIWNYFLDSWLY